MASLVSAETDCLSVILSRRLSRAIVGLETSRGGIGNAEEGAHSKEEDDRLHCLIEEFLMLG